MLSLQPIRLADLLLSRLLFADEKGMTTSELKGAVKAIAGSERSNSALTEWIETTLSNLCDQGYALSVSRSRCQITDTGRQHVLNQLGLTALPQKLQWNTFKNTDWIAYALQWPELSSIGRKYLRDADGLRAAILKHGFALPIKEFATLTQARNALLWQKFCDPKTAENLQAKLPNLQQQAFDQGAVMGVLLNEVLQTAKPLPWKQALSQVVAKVANARRTTPDELRLAILRQALIDTPETSTSDSHSDSLSLPSETIDSNDSSSPPSLSDTEFAEMTLQAAKGTKDGRLGDNKVFISKVWETLRQQHPHIMSSLDAFKQRLVTVNQQQLVTLSRADLAYALDSEDVSASEINHLNSTFHFIRLD
ncbi:MAG: hypothetical protein AAFY26_14275 [Cyanobacteria bacterium J06638_22]